MSRKKRLFARGKLKQGVILSYAELEMAYLLESKEKERITLSPEQREALKQQEDQRRMLKAFAKKQERQEKLSELFRPKRRLRI